MNRALVVIDVQQSFRELPSWAQISAPDLAERIAPLVEHARTAGDKVVWVLHSEPGSDTPFDPASGHVHLLPGLEPADGEPVLHKTSHNAFTTTNLGQLLTQWGVGGVDVAGIRTEQCVETTARLASDLGHDVRFVVDATATHPLPTADGSRVIPAEEVIERTAAALQGRFASVVTIAEVLAS
ncbi:MAG TPA: isochorismatase family protein [Intrasporangium sp.]|uniref:isochorismatase family protein n=1 Tax=Intrasporangium sp. TaxID=1925024 RepID=UPI002B474CFE|nr:isochorismatase family protein [Intrasporangium sp.]HKX65621.1 isochorismatase family protein [Intrasporangium sp.]